MSFDHIETLWCRQTFTGLSYQRTSPKDLSPSSNGLGSLPLIPYHYLNSPPCPMYDLKGKWDKEGLVMGSLRDNVHHHNVGRTAIHLHRKPIIFKILVVCVCDHGGFRRNLRCFTKSSEIADTFGGSTVVQAFFVFVYNAALCYISALMTVIFSRLFSKP